VLNLKKIIPAPKGKEILRAYVKREILSPAVIRFNYADEFKAQKKWQKSCHIS